MPYILALLVFVIAATGFSLLRPDPDIDTTPDTVAQEIAELISSSTESIETVVNEAETIVTDTEDISPVENTTPTPKPAPAPTPATKPEPTPTTQTAASDYKNGTYTTHVNYRVPENSYTMDVTLTIKNDVVTATNITYSSNAQKDGNTKRFDSAYETYVIGKDIDTIYLSRVGGASLTTKAFNNAVTAIKADAKS